MNKKSFILSSSGIKNLVENQNNEKEFTFFFGEKEIKMKNFFAEFVSPYVSQIHQSDPTIDYIHFNDKNSSQTNANSHFLNNISDDVLSLFYSVSSGNQIEIDQKQCFQLQVISILLKNKELYSILNFLFPNQIDEQNVTEYINFLPFFQHNLGSTEFTNYFNVIDYIANHFYSINEDDLIKIPKSIIYSIIKNKAFKVKSEDSLLDFIEKLFFKNDNEEEEDKDENEEEVSKYDFYEEIKFQYLSENKFREFIENFDASKITINLWRNLISCFYINKSINSMPSDNFLKNCYNKKGHQIEYDGKNPFNGIIHELRQKSGGNVDDKGIVKVTSSSVNIAWIAKYAVDLEDNSNYFQSESQANSWLKYDFKNIKIIPSHYSIRTRHDHGKGNNHPKNWVIEGSNDDKNWKILDRRNDVNCLDDRNVVKTFEISEYYNLTEGFRYLRMRQTGVNSADRYYLTLSALEYFGAVFNE